jgi:hypothetical protein
MMADGKKRPRKRLTGTRRRVYAEALREAVDALEKTKTHAEMIGREEDVGDINAALLALERLRKALLEPKGRGA